jgi:hypothetical protein
MPRKRAAILPRPPGIRFVIGRPLGSTRTAIQSVVFAAGAWRDSDARRWLHRQGFKPRHLDKGPRWLRYRLRDAQEFEPRSFRTIETGRRETVTMASNARKKKRRRSKARRSKARTTKRNPTRRAKSKRPSSSSRTGVKKRRRKARRAKRASPKAQTTRTTVKSVKVTKKNPRTRYTIALSPGSARTLAAMAKLSKPRRQEMVKSLRRHPRGGVYVALPTWHGSHREAQQLADHAKVVLAYAAGRRRKSLPVASLPRVVAVP